MGEKKKKKIRIAAVGDIHVKETDRGKWKDYFKAASDKADVLLLCGDLTDTGHAREARVLAEELAACTIPVVGVLGNHDYEADEHDSIREALVSENVHILDGESVVIKGIGFAGIKGFGGGFDRYMMPMFGETMFKQFVQASVDEALRLDRALARLDGENEDIKKIVVLHYSPIKATVMGEPEEIFPYLGSSRLVEPINRRQVEAAFHGHAHYGTLEGETTAGVKVFNVSKPILQKAGLEGPFLIYEL
jgi:Icc-related predicted phosphoesterase